MATIIPDMIKYTGTRDGKPFLGIGLSVEETVCLRQGNVVAVEGKTLGLCFDVVIVVHQDQDPATLADHQR